MNRFKLLLTLTLLTGCATTSGTRNLSAEEENKQVARAFIEELYNQRQFDKAPQFVAPDFVDHSPGATPDHKGPEFVRKQAEEMLSSIPDLHFDIQHVVAEGDLVLVHWNATGTNPKALDETGKPKQLQLQGHSLLRLQGAKLVESWDITDQLGFLLQQGFKLLPPAPASPGSSGTPASSPAES
ncbi:ester cyclase [Hyalangium versicolor]|uniref:ester cyclase n=1 Tax=Hyalangium versicolor TaxID=2861190 RepID=UPI001CCACF32|nr:ester cyclase [Hyalangium versicolor]